MFLSAMEYSRLLCTPTLFAIALLTPLLLFHLRQRKGGASTLLCLSLTLPLLPAYFLLHAQLRSAFIRGLFSFTLCWVIPNRLLLFCFHALELPAWSFSRPSHFLLSILLPIRIKGPSPSSPSAHFASYVRVFLLELFASICVGFALVRAPVRFKYPVLFLSTYLSVGMPSRVAAVVLHVLYRVELHPAFNKPWILPYSLTEFWGHGWNLTANALLRQSVYNPTMAHLLSATRKKPRDGVDAAGGEGVPMLWVRVVCVWATFLCSGLIHEFLWVCILQRSRPAAWENLWFFVLHGLGTSAEISCRRLFPGLPAKIPCVLKAAFTLTFVHTTMAWYLFAPQKAMPKITL